MSLQNQQAQVKGQQVSQQTRSQMQQAPQSSSVPMTTTQQSPQHQIQQSVQSPSLQQQQLPTQTPIQQQPSLQPSPQQSSLSPQIQPNIAAGTVVGAGRGVAAVRGGAKKKAAATRKASTGGGRAKAPEKGEDMKLGQMLTQKATDLYNQAHKLGVNTTEGSKLYKSYEDTMKSIQQININNQNVTSFSSMVQGQTSSSPTSISSPMNRPIAATTTMPSITSQQSMQQQQQHLQSRQQIMPSRPFEHPNLHIMHEINRIKEALSQPNITPSAKQECENRLNLLKNMMPSQPYISSQVRPPNISSPINTGNDLNRMQSSNLPSTTVQLQDGSMLSTSSMQHIIGQRTVLSPSLRPPQSPQQQLQQHSSQSVGSNEVMMDLDVEPSAQKTVELLTASSVATVPPRQVPPIAPAGILPSTLMNTQVGKIPLGQIVKTTASMYGSSASFPETPVSIPMDVDVDDRHLLPKRKVQQLVDQIDPKERLEPEVEEMLLEIADEFISSVASFACLLAKHRKSDTLEVKDLQLHLERNWNIRIPGFASDEIRSVRKPVVSTSHQQKLAAVMQAKTNKIANTTGQPN